jgi:hypothetical protein
MELKLMGAFFASARPGTEVTLGGETVELPILYFRDDAFGLFFTAKASKARAALPSDQLHPVQLPGGRALVGVMAFNYIDTTIGPYGEVAVVVLAVHGRRPAVGFVPAMLETGYPGFGMVVLHLPVTGTLARDGGRTLWGYSKFVADMNFTVTPEYLQCRLGEEGVHILTLRVARGGMVRRDTKPLVTYSVLDGELIRTTIPHRAVYRMALRSTGSFLELGEHEVAASIRELEVSSKPLMTRYYVERGAILPEGEVVERGVRSLEGYYGRDREGELTVAYTD